MPGFLSDLASVHDFLSEVDSLFSQGRYFGYAITKDDEVVGAISVKLQTGEPEVSYWVRSDLTGRGIATEALAELCDSLSCIDGFRLIHLRCDKANLRSQRVAENAGFIVQREQSAEKRTDAQSGFELMFSRSATLDPWYNQGYTRLL